jgi:hypothetical protein
MRNFPSVRLLLSAFLFFLLLAGVEAHPLLQNSMWVVFAPDRARVAVTALKSV